MSHNIDSLDDLRQEKERLKREILISNQYLDAKLEQTYNKGKYLVASKVSWPLALSSLAAFGAQQLERKVPPYAHDSAYAEFNLMDGIQQGVSAMQKPGKEKWYALLPLALRFLNQWLADKASPDEPTQYRRNDYHPDPQHTTIVPPQAPVAG